MNDFVDFEGKSVEQAVEKACQELKVSKDKLAYDIISYGSTGIFGLVRTKKALIRVTPPEGKPFEPTSSVSEEAPAVATPPDRDEVAVHEAESRSTIDALIDEAFGQPPANEDSETAPKPVPEGTEEAIAVAEGLLRQILDLLSPGTQISIHQDNDQHRIHISGGEPAILIGRKGQTLEAMQYLVDKAVNKQCGKGYRIVVDVEGYLETRQSELKEIANRLADKAKRTGKPSTMNRMNAHDRRIVHLALKSNKAVRTQSVGDGYYRKLMIMPKRRKSASKTGPRSRQSQ